ncbi:hypothetical protein FAGKG844_760013 [Frankia sp. AgKG'84/4]
MMVSNPLSRWNFSQNRLAIATFTPYRTVRGPFPRGVCAPSEEIWSCATSNSKVQWATKENYTRGEPLRTGTRR